MNIYCGRGYNVDFDEYVDFINYVFGFSGESRDFKKLLPKLYRPELKPQESNYVVTEDGRLRAAVGAYDHSVRVCGEELKCRGIGNVAVHPFHRTKGYMKMCMNAAIDDMIKDGVVMSTLGGRRQRYNYFGYDRCGSLCDISFTSDNIKHTYGFDYKQKFNIVKVSADSKKDLDNIYELINSQVYAPIRPRDELFAIMSSWHAETYTAYDGDRFVGYCVILNGSIREILLENKDELTDMLLSIWKQYGISEFGSAAIPVFYPEYIEPLYRFGEGCGINYNMSYSVLNYQKVIYAFMKLKATYESLPDGRFNILVHGRAGDEKLCISVTNGVICVEPTDADADIELGHLEAMAFLFGHTCPKRIAVPYFARIWFPLPIWMYKADEV